MKIGDRIELISMPNDPHPVEPGTLGTVTHIESLAAFGNPNEKQVSVDWDNGRSLMLVVPPDVVTVIT